MVQENLRESLISVTLRESPGESSGESMSVPEVGCQGMCRYARSVHRRAFRRSARVWEISVSLRESPGESSGESGRVPGVGFQNGSGESGRVSWIWGSQRAVHAKPRIFYQMNCQNRSPLGSGESGRVLPCKTLDFLPNELPKSIPAGVGRVRESPGGRGLQIF